MKIVVRSVTFIVAMIILASCINENTSECARVVSLRCTYTLNKYNTNLFGKEVQQIRIYAFDKDSLYIGSPDYTIFEEGDKLKNDFTMQLELPQGEYSFVAVGGDISDYRVGEMLNEKDNTFVEQLKEGVTTLSNFRLLYRAKETIGASNDLVVNEHPQDFYMGAVSGIQVNELMSSETIIDLTKNTNIVKVKLGGIQGAENLKSDFNSPFSIYCTSKNGRYNWENNVTDGARGLKYISPVEQIHPDTVSVEFKMMRLLTEGNSRMVIQDSRRPDKPIFDVDIVDEILRNPKYNSQEDIDREDEFTIIVSMANDVIVSITVNGWKTIYLDPAL